MRFGRFAALFVVAAVLLVAVSGCGQTETKPEQPAEKPPEKVVIKLGHHNPAGGTVDQVAIAFQRIIKEKSGGLIEVENFPGGQMGQEREAIDGIHMGTLQMSIVSPGLMDHFSPVMGLESLPFVFDSWEHADRALNGPAGEEMARLLLENSNIRLLGFNHSGFRQILTRNKPVTTVADIRNLKMRAPEAWAWTRMYELLGASPTPITWGEVYTALQTGVVDGACSPTRSIVDMKFYEVAKHVTLTNHMFGTMNLVINEQYFQSFNPEMQQIIKDAATEALREVNQEIVKPLVDDSVNALIAAGVQVHEVDNIEEWRNAVEPQLEEFYQKAPQARDIMKIIDSVR